MYADDSSLFFTGTTPNELINKANVELIKVFEWLKANKLSVNIKKNKYMLLSKKRHYRAIFGYFNPPVLTPQNNCCTTSF